MGRLHDELMERATLLPVLRAGGAGSVVARKAQGPKVYDLDNIGYVDYLGGGGSSVVGFANQFVLDAVKKALESGVPVGFHVPNEVDLSEKLAQFLPWIGAWWFCRNPEEAMRETLAWARRTSGKDVILGFQGGATVEPRAEMCPAGGAPAIREIASWKVSRMVEAITAGASEIAAVMVEPLMTRYGLIPLESDAVATVAEACRDEGMRLGFYYSQTADWHEPDAVGNTWDFPEPGDFTRYLHENILEYAERLTGKFEDELDLAMFCCTGSEANELALRLSRAYTGQRDTIVLESAYHGNTTSLIDISPYKHDGPGGTGAPPWVHSVPIADVYRGPFKADDPEAVLHVVELALAFRQTFRRDVVIDMICYRRHGHNEGDDPSYTQPLMYEKISQRPGVFKVYGDKLIVAGNIAGAGGVPVQNIVAWDGSSWSALGTGMNGSVWSLLVQDTDLYAGGDLKTA